jgi:hypothetical protein
MANKRHKPEEIVTKLRQVDVLVGQGMVRLDAIRQVSITEQTYYRWRGCCQAKTNLSLSICGTAVSGRELAPFCQGG